MTLARKRHKPSPLTILRSPNISWYFIISGSWKRFIFTDQLGRKPSFWWLSIISKIIGVPKCSDDLSFIFTRSERFWRRFKLPDWPYNLFLFFPVLVYSNTSADEFIQDILRLFHAAEKEIYISSFVLGWFHCDAVIWHSYVKTRWPVLRCLTARWPIIGGNSFVDLGTIWSLTGK